MGELIVNSLPQSWRDPSEDKEETSSREEKGMTSLGHTTLAKGLTKQRPLTNSQEIRTTCWKGGVLKCLFVFPKLMGAN